MSIEEQNEELNKTVILPSVALRGLTILPDMIIHFDLSRPKSILAVEKAMMGDQRLFLRSEERRVGKEC